MPLVTIEYPAGQLSAAQKTDLAEGITAVMLEIEGGGDTPFGRAGSMVRFRESAREDWFVGGTNDGKYVQGKSIFLVEIYVPEGLLDQQRKSQAHKAATDALARVTGASGDQTRYFWVQIFEWPDGSLASGGQTADLFGIAKRAGHATAHPVLEFPRAYFEAKNRLYDAYGFPAATAGRALNRY
jgi:phenylpyruvate tautomerase PptA (4-oxalocrotonate tautomerase family)